MGLWADTAKWRAPGPVQLAAYGDVFGDSPAMSLIFLGWTALRGPTCAVIPRVVGQSCIVAFCLFLVFYTGAIFEGSAWSLRVNTWAGVAQLARASAFQAEGRGFESRLPLHFIWVQSGHFSQELYVRPLRLQVYP